MEEYKKRLVQALSRGDFFSDLMFDLLSDLVFDLVSDLVFDLKSD